MVAVLVLSAEMFAQTAGTICSADRPVDDIITEINQQKSKKKSRTKSPLPDDICVAGWCIEPRVTPPTAGAPGSDAPDADPRYSPTPVEKCREATALALEAAHDVDVGDYYFEQKNYRAALLRYQDAVDRKPNDAAIYVRLGRALEKLGRAPEAADDYNAAVKLGRPEKWVEEARTALARLQTNQ